MAGWVITATTIYCDAVDDEVTLIVNKAGAIKCTGHDRYCQPGKETAREIKLRSRQLGRRLACEGLECHRVVQYRKKVLTEGDDE